MYKPKVAILATTLVPPHPAGSQILEVVDKLSNEFEFTIFAREIDARLSGKVVFRRMPIPLCKPLVLRYLVQYFLYGRLVKKEKLIENFDVVHAIEASSPYATATTMHFCGDAAKELMQKGIMKYKGWRKFYYPFLNTIGTMMERRMVRNPYLKDIIVVSNGLKKNVLTYYSDVSESKVKVIHNFADLERFTDAGKYRKSIRESFQLKDDDLVGVIVALGDWQRKGLDILIDAIAIKKNPKIKIFVAGGGPLELYQKICREKSVSDNFIFLGFQRELEKFYGASDFFIFPSAFEAFPLVLLEAAAAGLPILASKIDGTEEIVEDNFNGLFFQRDSQDISQKLDLIYKNPNLLDTFRKNILQKSNVYTRENMINQYRLFFSQKVSSK